MDASLTVLPENICIRIEFAFEFGDLNILTEALSTQKQGGLLPRFISTEFESLHLLIQVDIGVVNCMHVFKWGKLQMQKKS